MKWQIQAWPTPEIFIRRYGKEWTERGRTTYSLVSVVKPTADPRNAGAEPAAANFSLLSCYKNPPIVETETDHGAVGYSLGSVLVFTPSSESVTDSGADTFSLTSCFVLTPDVRDLSAKPDEPTTDYSLLSCNVI